LDLPNSKLLDRCVDGAIFDLLSFSFIDNPASVPVAASSSLFAGPNIIAADVQPFRQIPQLFGLFLWIRQGQNASRQVLSSVP
jgi:hypothetical protein